MNNDMVKGKWTEIKGEIRNRWGKLTSDELEKTEGNLQAIAGLIQQRYGETKEAAEEKLNKLFSRQTEKTKEALRDTQH